MPVTLTVMTGPHRGRRIDVGAPEFRIGRDPGCHLRPASRDVRPQHCAVVARPDGVFLRDDTWGGGTSVNGRLVVGGEVQLADRDEIGVGPLQFQVGLQSLVILDGDDDEENAPRASGPDTAAPRPVSRRDTNVSSRETAARAPKPGPDIKPMRDAREILCSN